MRAGLAALCVAFLLSCGPSNPDGGGGDDEPLECETGTGDCDGDASNGCETDLTADGANCGTCGEVCGTDHTTASSCSAGQCQLACDTGFDDCDGDAGNGCEAALDDSLAHCGACNAYCGAADASGSCAGGECTLTCVSGADDCNDDMTDGCESNLDTTQTCGSCDTGCAGSCSGGTCAACDTGIAVDTADPMDAARAMGLCADVTAAAWVMPDGSASNGDAEYPMGHGVVSGFGGNVAPRDGSSMLALSSGTARQPTDVGYALPSGYDKGYTHAHPLGFPVESPACPGVVTGIPHDGAAVELTLTVPDWAQGFSFAHKFYTYEWPGWICSQYNDFFVAMLTPIPTGQANGNIAFDSMGNPVSVNNAFLEVCGCVGGPPCIAGGKTFDCPLGEADLAGTGFEAHAATGWLVTTAPAEPGTQITLRLAVYDSGDGVLDSTALIDDFRWLPVEPEVETTPVD
jgi:hypothetical protein